MRRGSSRRSSRGDDVEEEDEEYREEDDDEEEEERAKRRRTHPPARRSSPRTRPAPIRRWRSSDDEEVEDEEEAEAPTGGTSPGKPRVYWRARDSLYFEPLVALAIIVVLIVSLFAYTQNWPPIYVVESNSMQHGPNDQVGLINTGDLVLAQKVPVSSIVPYTTGLTTGYSTYGEYGDVILFWPNGQGSSPIIHRSIVFLEWDPRGSYNATGLANLPCGNEPGAVYWTSNTTLDGHSNCGYTGLTGELRLFDIGWDSVNLTIFLTPALLGAHSGFVTMGDGNSLPDQMGAGESHSELVEPGWIIGVARGMIPWFGSLKLLLQGQAGEVPSQSWQFMGLTIVAAILIGFAIHYALRREGIETPLRREAEREAQAEAEAHPPPESLGHRFWERLRGRSSDEEESDEAPDERRRRRTRPPPTRSSAAHRGRPKPQVRRTERTARHTDSSDEL
jgi:signal peptidase